MPSDPIKTAITSVLSEDPRVLFAYLYGSFAENGEGNDIDIAVYAATETDVHLLSADLKVALHKRTGYPPDTFDLRVLNELIEQADIFGLLYLKNVLRNPNPLLDRDPDARTTFLERYGKRFRECEGLIQEALT